MRNSGPPPILFSTAPLRDWLTRRKSELINHINRLPRDQFMHVPADDLVENVVAHYNVEPLSLVGEGTSSATETHLDVQDYGHAVSVPAHEVLVRVPFTGNSDLWHLQPSAFDYSPPRGRVEAGHIVIERLVRSGHKANLKASVDKELDDIREYVRRQRNDIDRYQQELPQLARKAIAERRGRLEEQEGLLESIGLPLERQAGMPEYRPVPLRRTIKPLPPAPPEGYKAEPAITEQQFDDILSLVRHQGRTFEQAPSSFSALGEEALRDVVLAALNTHYKGAASAETFRHTGKTDIRIEAEDRSAFVAECKLWKGKGYLVKGLEQLLGYLTFRDAKASLIVFNKNVADRACVLAETQAAIEEHGAFKRREGGKHADGESRYVLRSLADESRDVHCHVFVFHMPSPGKRRAAKKASPARKRKRRATGS